MESRVNAIVQAFAALARLIRRSLMRHSGVVPPPPPSSRSGPPGPNYARFYAGHCRACRVCAAYDIAAVLILAGSRTAREHRLARLYRAQELWAEAMDRGA